MANIKKYPIGNDLSNLYVPNGNTVAIGVINGAKLAAGDTNLTPVTSKPATKTSTKTSTDTGTGSGSEKPTVPETSEPTVTDEPSTITTATGFEYEDFTGTDAYWEAMGILDSHKATNPGAFDWTGNANYGLASGYLDKYENRDPFSYDFNSDALYNQYKDQYIQQGQMAMMDTMGQASAMTGGYGNSYAQMVGQQTYNQYLNQLNEIMPELYDRAYNRYNQEGEDLLNMYELYMGRAKDEYSIHQDNLENYYKELNYLQGIADSEYEKGWNEYTTDLGILHGDYTTQMENDRTDKTNKYNNLVNLIGAGHNPTAEELAEAGMTEAQANTLKKSYENSLLPSGDGREYKWMDTETTSYFTKKFAGAKTAAEVMQIGLEMDGMGIYQDVVDAWVERYLAQIENAEEPEQVPEEERPWWDKIAEIFTGK